MQAFILRYIQRAVLFLTVIYQHNSVVSQRGLLYVFPQGALLSKDLHGFVVSYRDSMLFCIAMIFYSRYEFLIEAHKCAMHRYLLLNTLTRFRCRDPGNYIYRPITSISLLSHQLTASCGNRLHSIAGTQAGFMIHMVHTKPFDSSNFVHVMCGIHKLSFPV